jgi:vang-like
VYDVDSPAGDNHANGMTDADIPADMRRFNMGHNDRFHQELEYERKVARRRARLLTAAEEAFSIVRPVQVDEKG